MARMAVITGGVVVNVINADPSFTIAGSTLVETQTAGTGWTYADGMFAAPVVDLGDRRSRMKDAVMALRDERIDAGVSFAGHEFQTRADDRENVQGAAQLAALWLMAGGAADSLRWHGGVTDFVWIDADNDLQPLTAVGVIDFGKAVAALKSACIFNAYAIKEAIDAAADHAALDAIDINAGWP